MSRTTIDSTVFPVHLEDDYGARLCPNVDVCIEYVQEVEFDYGADADGNRGTTLVSYEILDCYLAEGELNKLTIEQVGQVIEEAKRIFHDHPKHF